jgi:hypothetical protein
MIAPFASSVCQFCPFAKIKLFSLQLNLSCASEIMTSGWKTQASCRRNPDLAIKGANPVQKENISPCLKVRGKYH